MAGTTTDLLVKSPDAFMPDSNNKGIPDLERSVFGSKTEAQLGADFQPSDYSVLFCCGKDGANHVGNHRFQILCSTYVERYSRTDSKRAKSVIVSEIITAFLQAGGGFFKHKKGGAWFEVEDQYVRGKVSAVLRNMLHNEYRSSNKSKTAIRRASRKQSKNKPAGQELVDDTGDSDDSSLSSSCWGGSDDILRLQYSQEYSFFDIDVF
jgi:hypothetical protein